jgi:hypothetical protein
MEETAAKSKINQLPLMVEPPSIVSAPCAADDFGWPVMSIDEYAQQQMGMGSTLRKVNGLWWRQIRPFFYRPLFLFTRFVPGSCPPPPGAVLVGYHHLVPSDEFANSEMRLLVFDNLADYSLDQLPHAYRRNTRKGLKNFEIRRIWDLKHFLTEGFRVYLSFHDRTGWEYKAERTDPNHFTRWARGIFKAPKTVVWGAYSDGRLRAVTISFRVENVIISPTYFADSEALRLRISEAMLHFLRARAAEAPGAKYVFMGVAGSKYSLDDFKMSRGCKLLGLPAYAWLNPVVSFAAKHFRKRDYQRLFLKAAGVGTAQYLLDCSMPFLG